MKNAYQKLLFLRLCFCILTAPYAAHADQSYIWENDLVSIAEQHQAEALTDYKNPNIYISPFSNKVSIYVDCAGSDANDGTSPSKAVRSFKRLRQLSVKPGTVIGLKRGCTWAEHLKMDYQGTANLPVVLTSYGQRPSPMPKIIVNAGTMPLPYNPATESYVGADPTRDVFSGVSITGSFQIIESLEVVANQAVLENGPRYYVQGQLHPDTWSNCQYQKIGWVIGFEIYSGATANILRFNSASLHATAFSVIGGSNGIPQHNLLYSNWAYYNNVMRALTTKLPGELSPVTGISLAEDDAGASAFAVNYANKNVFHKNIAFGNSGCSLDFNYTGTDWGFDGSTFELYNASENYFLENYAHDFNFMEMGGSPGLVSYGNHIKRNTFFSYPVRAPYELEWLFLTEHKTGTFAGSEGTVGGLKDNYVFEAQTFPW